MVGENWFLIHFDMSRHEKGVILDLLDRDTDTEIDPYLFAEGQKVHYDGVVVALPDVPLPDYTQTYAGVPIVSQPCYDALSDLISGDVQVFPVLVGMENRFLLNVWRSVKCLDVDRSGRLEHRDVIGGDPDDYHSIDDPFLVESMIPHGTNMFRLGNNAVWLIVSNKIRDLFIEREIGGASFTPIRSG